MKNTEQQQPSNTSPEKTLTRRRFLEIIGATTAISLLSKTFASELPRSVSAQTVPLPTPENPTPTPEVPNNPEEYVPRARFKGTIEAFDQQGNPTAGVRIVTATFGNGEVGYIDGGWRSGAKNVDTTNNEGKFKFSREFAQSSQEGIIIGEEAAALWDQLASEGVPMPVDAPAHQNLQEAKVVISNIRAVEGEGPMRVTARLKVPANPETEEYSATIVTEWPAYRRGTLPVLEEGYVDEETGQYVPPVLGAPIELGEVEGFLEPISTDIDLDSQGQAAVNLIARISTSDTPSIVFETAGELISVYNEANPAIRRSTIFAQDEEIADQSDLLLSVVNYKMLQRQEKFEELLQAQAGEVIVKAAGESGFIGKSLVIEAIKSTRSEIIHRVQFKNDPSQNSLEVLLSDVRQGDRVELRKVGNLITWDCRNNNGHMPTIQIVETRPAEPNPEEPSPQEPNPEDPRPEYILNYPVMRKK